MRAFSTASGSVMFVPDEIERVAKPVSYTDLVKDEPRAEKFSFSRLLFGRRKKDAKDIKEAA